MVKRKIPVRKHHGVRDILRQKASELDRIKNKINNPPSKNDQEKIPYSLSQMIRAKHQAKYGKIKKKINIGIEDKPKNVRNKIKPVKRFPNENDIDYLRRINRATTDALKEAEYEIKYGVEVHRNAKTGEITIKKKPKDEFAELTKNKKKIKEKKEKDQKKVNLDPKLSKQLIKQVLKEEKLEKKKFSEKEEFKKDEIKFGEIVHAPPSFSVIPRKAKKNETVPRPGRKDLLLKTILDENQPKENIIKIKSQTNFKGKRKDLADNARNMIEAEREKVVELYRKIKKTKT